MLNNNGFITIQEVLNAYKAGTPTYLSSEKLMLKSFLKRALIDLQINITKQTTTTKLKIEVNGIVKLPDNFFRLKTIGVGVDGRIVKITHDNNLIPKEVESFTSTNANGRHYPFRNLFSTQYGNDNRNSRIAYKEDLSNQRLITIGGKEGDELILEYMPVLYKENKIPIIFQEAIIAYMEWKYAESKKTAQNEIIRKQMKYGDEKINLQQANSNFIQEIVTRLHRSKSIVPY